MPPTDATHATDSTDSTDSIDDEVVARVRASLVTERAHFNHAGTSLPPAGAVARMHAQLDLEEQIGGYEAMIAVADEVAAVPALLAPLFAADPDEIVPTESATRAWETVLWSMAVTGRWSAGDRVLVDQFAYGTMFTGLAALHATTGVAVEVLGAHADGSVDPAALRGALDDRVRLVLVTHVPTHLGTVADTAGVAAVLRESEAIYALDVSQTLGQLPLDVGVLGCDVAFAPGRKFLRAPRGTGVLYVRAALAERLTPLAPPSGTASPDGALGLPPAARRFDQFEFSLAARLGLGIAAQTVHDIGIDRIERLVGDRSRDVLGVLGAVPGLRLTGTPDDRAILSFVHDSLEPAAVVAHAATTGVNLWVNPAVGAPLDLARRPVLPSVRVSPHYFTNDEDLDRLDRAVRSLPA